jgi:acyl carrier protein
MLARRHSVPTELSSEVVERDEIRSCVFRAIERVKELTLNERELMSADSTVLLGEGAVMDSMSLVNFVVALEEELSRISAQRLDVAGMLSSPKGRTATTCTAGQLIDLISHLTQCSPLS